MDIGLLRMPATMDRGYRITYTDVRFVRLPPAGVRCRLGGGPIDKMDIGLLRMRDWAIDTRDTRARDDGPRISYYVY
jgi:hypothetical protein